MKKALSLITSSITLLLIFAISTAHAAVEEGQQFKNWRGVCLPNGKCGVEQKAKDAGGKLWALAFIQKTTDGYVMHVRVPLYVNLEDELFVLMGEEEVARTPYFTCHKGGCESIVPLNEDLINRLRARKEMHIGIIEFFTNKGIKFRVSLNGISSALDAL